MERSQFDPDRIVERLGGGRHAARQLSFYLRCPKLLARRRGMAALCLLRCGEAALPELEKVPWDEETVFYKVVDTVHSADTFRDPRALGLLAAALNRDQPYNVRITAVLALEEMGSARAVPLLRRALTDEHRDIRQTAREALEKVEEEGRE
jgi:hypothetical protein